jgi:hypothetical protein
MKPMTEVKPTKEIVSQMSNCTAVIESVNSRGLMIIRFSTPMKPQNITLYNSEFIDIYIMPSNDQDVYEPGLEKLNLTWQVTEMKADYMKVKLNFTNELAISSHLEQDQVVFHIKEQRELFISETLLQDLSANSTTLLQKVPKQVSDSLASDVLIGSAEGVK